jgi:hypothetical protein
MSSNNFPTTMALNGDNYCFSQSQINQEELSPILPPNEVVSKLSTILEGYSSQSSDPMSVTDEQQQQQLQLQLEEEERQQYEANIANMNDFTIEDEELRREGCQCPFEDDCTCVTEEAQKNIQDPLINFHGCMNKRNGCVSKFDGKCFAFTFEKYGLSAMDKHPCRVCDPHYLRRKL